MSAEQPSKRRRAGELGLLGGTPQGPRASPQSPPSAGRAAGAQLGGFGTPLPGFGSPAAEDLDSGEPRPDVFEFLAQRSQKQRDLEGQVAALEAREAELKRQLADAQKQASGLRAEAAGATQRYLAQEASLQLRCREAEEGLRREVERGARLQAQLQHAQEAAAAAEQRAGAATTGEVASPAPGSGRSAKEQQLQFRVAELELELGRAVAEKEEVELRARHELGTERQRSAAAAETSRLLEQKLEEALAAAEGIAQQKHGLESRAAELERQVVQLEAQVAQSKSSEGDAVVVRSLREQLRAQEAAVAEARRLKDQARNVHVLREQLEAAEARARRGEELLEGSAQLQGRVAELETQLQHWTLILEGTAECSTPEDVLHFLKRLQADQVAATEKLGARADELAALKAAASAAEEARASAESRHREAAARAEELAATLARAERKAGLLAKEREGLKAILASYDEEYLNHQGGQILPQQARIAELEGTMEGLHGHIRSLEEELRSRGSGADQAAGAGPGTSAALQEALQRAEAAEARAALLEQQADNLGRQVALLEERVGRGEYNAATTRVLHFKYNPEAELAREARDAHTAQLESENGALKQHIQRLEQAQAQGLAASPGGGGGNSMRVAQLEGENNLLKTKVAQLQKSADRLQQVFNKQITLFREAVYILFGYRVEMATDPTAREFKAQFVLRPQQSEEGSGEELVFRLLRDGRMVLVPTPFSSGKLQREVDTFIDRFKSIPAFTANLTMEWFQRQTQC